MTTDESALPADRATGTEIRRILDQLRPYLPQQITRIGSLSEDYVVRHWILWVEILNHPVAQWWPLDWTAAEFEVWFRARLEELAQGGTP